jgi:hypothetical protein
VENLEENIPRQLHNDRMNDLLNTCFVILMCESIGIMGERVYTGNYGILFENALYFLGVCERNEEIRVVY